MPGTGSSGLVLAGSYTHSLLVLPINNGAMSILAITLNYTKASSKMIMFVREKWSKMVLSFVKLNGFVSPRGRKESY